MLFLGKLLPSKGLYELIDALAMLRGEFPNLELIVGGSGNSELFHNYAKKSGVGDAVTFSGWIDGERKLRCLSQSTIFVLPSYHEGLPVSILEAMTMRTPIVATNVGGIPDVIDNGVEGILVQPKDALDLKSALEVLLRDENLRKSMGDSAKVRVESEFSPENVLPKIEQIYQDLGVAPIPYFK